MQEALNEWLISDKQNMEFHIKQYERPYRSTVVFLRYLQEKLQGTNNRILDLGCGAGAALGYILSEDKEIFREGIGIDINESIVEIGNRILKERKVNNCTLKAGNIFQISENTLGANELVKMSFRTV